MASGGQRIVQTGQGPIMVARPQGQPVQVLPGAQLVRTSGIMVGGHRPTGPMQNQMIRPQPGMQTIPSTSAGVQNIVIRQNGSRPGQPGAQITVPLATLQGLQAGQGIPTGQPGHLLVKTETGQYQILRVGPPGPQSNISTVPQPVTTVMRPTAVAVTSVQAMRTTAPMVHQMRQPTMPTVVRTVAQPTAVSSPQPQQSQPQATATSAAAASNSMGQQMTPDTAKIKCKNFLATLLRLASDQPEGVAKNVRALIQGLIDGRVEPEIFTTKLQKELNSSPQPCLVPFLKKSLPYLQHSLATLELSIEGVRPPPLNAVGKLPPAVTAGPPTQLRINTPAPGGIGTISRPVAPFVNRPITPIRSTYTRPEFSNVSSMSSSRPGFSMPQPQSNLSNSSQPVIRDKKSAGNSYSAAGDDDINDVAAMGGVNLQEEANRILGSTDNVGTVIRSCKDETFLQTGLLHQKISRICKEKGLEPPSAEVIGLVSHATQDRLKTLVSKLSVIAEHRLDIIKTEGPYEVTDDIKGQIRFLEDLDKMEKKRQEEMEREMLIRAAKSRTKTDDPEKEKMKAKAKELQRIEQEQQRHSEANATALAAIGGPKSKKFKFDDNNKVGSSVSMRPRTKRVHLRDVIFLMEQEKDLRHSPLLFRSYCS